MALYGASVEYALHCLLYLADAAEQTRIPSQDLAQFQGLSPSYVAKLFAQLKAADLVVAREGIAGGYALARPAEKITVLDVVLALEGDKPLFHCQDIRAQCVLFAQQPPAWATKGVCAIHAVMLEAQGQMRETLRRHTLADLAQRLSHKAPRTFGASTKQWFSGRRRIAGGR